MREYVGYLAMLGIVICFIANFIYLFPVKIYETYKMAKEKCKKSIYQL